MGVDRQERVLRVCPDYHADPVWSGWGMVDLDGLAISSGLRAELRAWAREWEQLMGTAEARYEIVDEEAHRLWKVRGGRLAAALQSELGAAVVVRYEAQ